MSAGAFPPSPPRSDPVAVDVPLSWSEPELLAGHDIVEPLVAGGVRCHGGFTADGAYVSPRTKNRVPAIAAWQESHRQQFGTEIVDAPIELWPDVFPNVAQTKYLLRERVRRADGLVVDAHRHGGRLRLDDPHRARRPAAVTLRGVDHRHRGRAPAPRALRGARARRSRLGRQKAATSRCGSRRETSRSATRSPTT